MACLALLLPWVWPWLHSYIGSIYGCLASYFVWNRCVGEEAHHIIAILAGGWCFVRKLLYASPGVCVCVCVCTVLCQDAYIGGSVACSWLAWGLSSTAGLLKPLAGIRGATSMGSIHLHLVLYLC